VLSDLFYIADTPPPRGGETLFVYIINQPFLLLMKEEWIQLRDETGGEVVGNYHPGLNDEGKFNSLSSKKTLPVRPSILRFSNTTKPLVESFFRWFFFFLTFESENKKGHEDNFNSDSTSPIPGSPACSPG